MRYKLTWRDKPVVEWIRQKYADLANSLAGAWSSHLGSRGKQDRLVGVV